jgi:hypothetical protein
LDCKMNTRLNKYSMKIRIAFLSLLAVSSTLIVSAQTEYDDMYFSSKDRAKVQASRPMTLKSIASEHEVATAINPTDSYSARNVNPEYISQSKVGSGSTEVAPYFIPDYTPISVNQNISSNNSSNYYNSTAGYNPYYGMNSGFASPYNNSFYNSMYGGYGYSPYGYNSGWSSFLTLGMGMGMGGYYPYGGYPYGGSSWNMGMGFGSPSYGWNPYSMGMGYMGMGYGYYPPTVIILNDNYHNSAVYGKRPSRSSDLNNNVSHYNNRGTAATVTDSQGRVRSSGSRVSSDGNPTTYYQPGWRTNPETNSAVRSNWSTSGRSGGNTNDTGFRSNSGNDSRSSFFNSGGSRSSNWSGGSSGISSGGGSRSSGSVSGGSSSGVRRGRD